MVVIVLHLTTLFSPFPFPFLFLNRIIFLVNKKEKNRKRKKSMTFQPCTPIPKKVTARFLPTYLPTCLFLSQISFFGMK